MWFAACLLWLLFSVSPGFALGQSQAAGGDGTGVDAPPELSVIWDELQGLNELVLSLKAEEVDGRQSRRRMESRLRDRETEAEQQRQSLDRLQERTEVDGKRLTEMEQLEEQREARLLLLQSRLNVSENSVEDLKRKNTALAAELPFLQTRLRASESTVEQLRRKNTVLAARLCNIETLMEELRLQISVSSPSEVEPRVHVVLTELNTNSDGQTGRLSSVETQTHPGEIVQEFTDANSSSSLKETLSVVQLQLLQVDTNLTVQSDGLKQLRVQLNSAVSRIHELQAESSELLDRLQVGERRVEEVQKENTDLRSRLSVGEQLMEDLRRERSDQSRILTELQRKLNATDAALASSLQAGLWANATALQLRLGSTETRVDRLETRSAALESRLGVGEEDVQRENRAQARHISLLESRLAEQHNGSAALQLRLGSTETRVDRLETRSAVQAGHISLLQSGLSEQHNGSAELRRRLSVSETQLEHLETENAALRVRLNESDARLQLSTKTNSDDLKVAFSAGLTDSGAVGPFDEERTLIFSKTLTNVGRAYDRASGVFTAPVAGVYFFTFTAADYLKGYMGLYLYRNNQPIIFNLDLNDHGGYASTSNGVTLQLQEGDRVRLSLPASYRLYDDSRNFSTFSGFLLFPL